jgi:hypothetical protein
MQGMIIGGVGESKALVAGALLVGLTGILEMLYSPEQLEASSSSMR